MTLALAFWIVFALLLAGGVAACIYWLRVANREWALYEEMLIGRREDSE